MTFDEFFEQLGCDDFNKDLFAEYTDDSKDRPYTVWNELYANFLKNEFTCPLSTQTNYGDYTFCVTKGGKCLKNYHGADVVRRFKDQDDARDFLSRSRI